MGTGVAAVFLIVALAAAVSVDVVRAGFGIKGDEATYVAMALSLAYDHDLTYERQDLERFWTIYRTGPEGIFLKRGKQVRFRLRGSPPYIQVSRVPDPRTDRLYFAKALIYPLAVAPFVRVAGLNGFLIFHVLLLFGVGVCGYYFLAARSRRGPALLFTLAFLGATVIPVYAVFLAPEIFNFSLVFFAYFLWLYKEVAPPAGARFLRTFGADICAAVLLGLAAYSKPFHLLLIGPLIALAWWRRKVVNGLIVGAVFAVATAALFGVNWLSSGELNYQGGDRKTCYSGKESFSGFPFESPDSTWERRCIPFSTNDSDAANVLEPSEFVNRFGLNVEYFLIGRHFGFVPYYFPGAVAILLWVGSSERFRLWRLLTFAGLVTSALALLIFAPYTWSGGGGPPGNRYFLSLYPVVFFLTPGLVSPAPAVLAWLGGALFTAKMVVNPFVAAKFTYQAAERGFARRLPVELTMGNDLPVALDPQPRAHIPYGFDPTVLLYFLDQHAYPPEPDGMWIAGDGRADILVRSERPLDHLVVTVMSPIATTFTISAGGTEIVVPLIPNKPAFVNVPTYGVRGLKSYAYLLSARSSGGFVPHLRDPKSNDSRVLGAQLRFKAVEAAP